MDNDEITCEREATSASRKRPLEEAATRIEAAAPSSAGAGSDCMQPASDQMTMSGLSTSTPNDVFFRVRLTTKVQG